MATDLGAFPASGSGYSPKGGATSCTASPANPSIPNAVLPCPFCGQRPEVFGSGEGQRGLMIHCVTDGCVNPSVSYYDHATAKRVWNNRQSERTGA